MIKHAEQESTWCKGISKTLMPHYGKKITPENDNAARLPHQEEATVEDDAATPLAINS